MLDEFIFTHLSLPSTVYCANIRRNLQDQQNPFLSAALWKPKITGGCKAMTNI